MTEIRNIKKNNKNTRNNKRNFKYRRNNLANNWNLDTYNNHIVTSVETTKTTDDSDYEQRRVNSLLHVIFKICELSGYWIEERIVLKDRKTGKIWR